MRVSIVFIFGICRVYKGTESRTFNHWEGLQLMMPGQLQRLMVPLWKQKKMIILKEYALLGA